MATRFRPLDLNQVQTDSVRRRTWRLGMDQLAAMPEPSAPLHAFFGALPKVGAASDLVDAAKLMAQAALGGKPILWLADGKLISAGLSPLLVYMMRRNLIQCLALNGQAAVQDYELAFHGMTDEDTAQGLTDGRLGLSRETGEVINGIINEGVKRGFSIGECLGRGILDRQPRFMTNSLLATGAARLTPVTIHISLGADGFHRFPGSDGAMLGKGSLKDAYILSSFITQMPPDGLIVAAQDDPMLSQVFMNAFALARNMNEALGGLNLIQLGKPMEALEQSSSFTRRQCVMGPLEINIPLLMGALFSLVE